MTIPIHQLLLGSTLAFFLSVAVQQIDQTPIAQKSNVYPPVLIDKVEPKCPSHGYFHLPKSRSVKVYLIVNVDGMPEGVRIEESGGPGFDENALATVGQYRFKPATQDGKPVKVDLSVMVNYVC